MILSICLSHELRTITNMFVINLAVADILIGLQPIFGILSLIKPEVEYDVTVCRARMWIIAIAGLASLGTLSGESVFTAFFTV